MVGQTQVSKEAEAALSAATAPSCDKCFHFKVCAIARAFIPLLSNSFPDDQGGSPIQPTDLAKICTSYINATGVLTA